MKMNTRTRWKLCALLVVSICAAWLFLTGSQPPSSTPSGPAYYTGPMRSKSDPNVWITADGQRAPPPPDAIPLPASRSESSPRGGKMSSSD